MDETIKKYQDKNKYYGDKLHDAHIKEIRIVHSTKGVKGLLGILKTGYIKLGSTLKESQRKLSGGEPQKYIFGNIVFNDVNKEMMNEELWQYTVIINPKILNEYNLHFNGL